MIPEIEQHRDEIIAICEECGLERLEVFGSATTGVFDAEQNDVYFLVVYPEGFGYGPWGSPVDELRERLERILERKVDLGVLRRVDNLLFDGPSSNNGRSHMHNRTLAKLWELHRARSYRIERTMGKSAAEIKDDYELSLVVERPLERIGETVHRIELRDPQTARFLPDSRRAVNLRNIIAHSYYSIDWARIKATLHESIPEMLAAVDQLTPEIPKELS